MNALATADVSPTVHCVKFHGMARQKAVGDRYFVRLTAEEKRKLDFLTVGAGADSTEAFAGRMLAEAIEKAWAHFDAKKAMPTAEKPAKKTK